MSGSRTSVLVVSLLAFSLLHTVWAVDNTSDPGPLKADVVFMLDTSEYMTEELFAKAKNFTKAFAGDFDIDPNGLNMGVITYDEDARNEFWLNNYTTNSSLLAAIDNITFIPGTQSPHMAPPLELARENAFNEANGDRKDVLNFLIVLGAGQAVDENSTEQEKAKFNINNTRIYSVSFCSNITQTVLTIASRPENNFLVTADNDLDSVRVNLTKAVSEEIAAFLPPEPTVSTNSSSRNTNEITVSSSPNTTETTVLSSPNTTEATVPSSPDINESTNSSSRDTNETTVSSSPDATESTNSSSRNTDDDEASSSRDTNETPVSSSSNTNVVAPPYFPPQQSCMDSHSSCAKHGGLDCVPGSLWAQYICPKYCGTCVQHCDYGGQWYRQGAKWQDGCAYDCECVDGATGHYQCYNKCPTYLSLPPFCTLAQLPGVCCLQPMCDFGAIYQTISGQDVGKLNGYQACVYKGKKYHQSERWTVGCDLQCFCDDAAVGLYTCHSKCAQYGMLPSNCRLVKKPGECCAKPECQFYTTKGPFVGVGRPSENGQSVYTVFAF